jgi:hypothetical protein
MRKASRLGASATCCRSTLAEQVEEQQLTSHLFVVLKHELEAAL